MTTLVQITDVHLVAQGTAAGGVDPTASLALALDAVVGARLPLAAVLFTGDLVDAGDAASYRRLREILAPFAQRVGAPLLFAAGNHDDRAELREHLLGELPSTEPYDHVTRLGGLRVIVLDTTVPGASHGELRPDQLGWLAAELAVPAPDGTVLALHHPPLPSPSRLATAIELRDRAALAAVIRGSDVRLVLAGHTHVTSAGSVAGVPVWVGGSTATTWYGMTPAGEGIVAAPSITRVDLFDDELLVSTVPLGAPGLGSLDAAHIDELVAAAANRAGRSPT